ncbi:MAG: hypothetical protein L6Q77_00865 [Bacteroidetes bacterium]|nr:hypothetical protein [Bacteroidota bacterium]
MQSKGDTANDKILLHELDKAIIENSHYLRAPEKPAIFTDLKEKGRRLLFVQTAVEDGYTIRDYFKLHIYYEKRESKLESLFFIRQQEKSTTAIKKLIEEMKYLNTPYAKIAIELHSVWAKIGKASELNPTGEVTRSIYLRHEVEKLRIFVEKIPQGGDTIYKNLPLDIKRYIKTVFPTLYEKIEKHIL